MYPPEFRRDAVALVLEEQRPIVEVARAVGVNEHTLGNWVRAAQTAPASPPVSDEERAELAALRAEVATLRTERDLLKRSLAFWVKETSTS